MRQANQVIMQMSEEIEALKNPKGKKKKWHNYEILIIYVSSDEKEAFEDRVNIII